jgi:replicative DNA helicase
VLIAQREAVKQAAERHHDNLDRPTGLYGHDWGHHDWNMALAGIVPSTITTLGAKSRTGKTAALIQLMKAAGRVHNGKRADLLFFSWEMSARANIERLVCHDAEVTMQEYRYAKFLPEARKDAILKAYSEATKLPVQYHGVSSNIDEVIDYCKRHLVHIKKMETIDGVKIQPVVAIDYVSMARPRTKYGSKTYDLADFMQTFKQFANQEGIAGLFLAQVRRDVEGEPGLEHIQDSGAFEQNSDNIVLMYRPEADNVQDIRDPYSDQMESSRNRVMWRFLKCREGSPRDVLGACDMRYFKFWHRGHTRHYDYTKDYLNDEFWKQEYGL